jgi:helicase-like protein
MPEAAVEEIELEEEACQTVETEQERLDRDGIYGEIKRELIKRGIPAHEIAFIHDFKTPAEKAMAFADANAGKIGVMIASTEKAGAGTNMQERLAALHHLDGPWRPSDVEQREGRILRPMNRFAEVSIFNYVTEQSFDVYIWQTLESKARFIAQIMSGNVTARTAEDVDDMVITAAQVKAIATGNPQILEKVSVEVELSRLSRLYTVWRNGRRDLKWELQSLPRKAQEAGLRVACHEQAVAVRDQHGQDGGKAFAIEIRSALRNDQCVTFDKRAQAGEHLEKLRRQVESLASVEAHHLGSYRGFEIFAQRGLSRVEGLFDSVEGFLRLPGGQFRYAFSFSDSAQGTLQSIDASLRKLDSHLQSALRDQAELRHKQEQIEKALSSGWAYAARYEEFREKLRQVNRSLRETGSQIDDKQVFAVLDPEAFQRCERDESPIEEAKESFVAEASAAAPPEVPAVVAAAQSPIPEDAGTPQPSGIVEERQHTSSPITLDDLRRQLGQSPKRRSPTVSSVTVDEAQMSLW